MANKAFIERLRRWQKMDRLLSQEGLEVEKFAKECGRHPRSIKRDLEALEQFLPARAYPILHNRTATGEVLTYKPWLRPLFTANFDIRR
jgi:hypothetical protein